jgi:hypothetical protein
MKAIVYTSNSGFTKKYAGLLSAKTALPAYNLKEAKDRISKGDDIIYMGWLCAGTVAGYNKAVKSYSVKAVCAVGMGSPAEKVIAEIKVRHNIENIKIFCLQGGFDMNKLHGIYKFMMKMIAKTAVKKLEAKPDKTAEEADMLDMMKNGKDCVNEEKLAPVIEWLGQIK